MNTTTISRRLFPILKAACRCAPTWFLASALLAGFMGTTVFAQDRQNCLKAPKPDREATFNKLFDAVNVNKASFSCTLFVPASEVRDSLESFRYGVLYGDKRRFDHAVRYPFTVIVEKPSEKRAKIVVHNYEEWLALKTTAMTKLHLRTVRCSWLGNLTVVGAQSFNPGFIINDGLVFFSTSDTSNVRVTLVDLTPMTEEMVARSCAE